MDVYIKHTDHLPVLVSAQILLKQYVDSGVNVTGWFNPSTRRAILKMASRFYRPTGDTITGQSWLYLLKKSGLKVIDVIDGADPAEVSTIDAIRGTANVYAGARMIVTSPQSNSIRDVISKIAKFSGNLSIILLRFHGHGSPGYQGISCGKAFTPEEKTPYSLILLWISHRS